jgi:hypothetical protein
MPRLLLELPHALDQNEAVRRLKEKFAAARAEYGVHVTRFHDEWKDHTFSFSLHALGMGVNGTLSVEPRKVTLDVALPLAAMLFKRAIEDRLRQEVDSLLASPGSDNAVT